MTLQIQDNDGLLAPTFEVPAAAFVIQTIEQLPEGRDPINFTWRAKERNIPLRPWSFGTGVTTSRNDYPGTVHRPTEQIINVHFKDFTLRGKWLDRWNFSGYAVKEWERFEELVNLGVKVRLNHQSVYVNGIITSLDVDYFTESEIHYSFTFSPHEREPGQPLKFSPRTVLNSTQLLDEVKRQRDLIVDFHDTAPRFFVAGQLWVLINEAINDINTNIDILDNIIIQRVLLPEVEPGIALKRIAAVFRLIRSNSETIAALLRPSRSDLNLTVIAGQQVLSFGLWSKGVSRGANLLTVGAERASREMLSRAEPNLIALYSPSAGEHLMKIANLFYNNPFDWKRIATRNNLGANLCMTGEELLIIPEAVARQ